MSHPLIVHIDKLVSVNVDDEAAILSFFRPIQVSKKQNLIEAGHPCSTLYFVVKGCIRLFYLNEKGVEQTLQFAIENWWLTDFMAFPQQGITEFTIQAVENSQLLAIDTADQERMLDQFPPLERYFRLIYQRAYGASQVKMKYQYDYSREQLYHHFIDNFPQFTQRIPQYLLASYLGFTPEYLSELRKKRS
ncbi:MAG: Crp/Fnr family transcriptional regulator [Dyadobacter sp.]|uniref:Crp/Fnr family transcriptional regulator n=1 Tax=Dyadobacter sp. TaxID=1914288 RepID=UPI003263EBD7